jgi:hypothetical protein
MQYHLTANRKTKNKYTKYIKLKFIKNILNEKIT